MTRIFLVLIAPLEIAGCAIVGAWKGFKMGIENVRDEWNGADR